MTDRNEEQATLTIGQFGRVSQLSRKALRLYEERQLLMPARTDPFSGYRYYQRSQVAMARRIRLLRLMGMPLEQIGVVLATWGDDPVQAQQLIQTHVRQMEDRITAVHLAARLLREELLTDKERQMSFTFDHAEQAAQLVVSIRRRVTVPTFHELMMPTFKQLWEHIKTQGGTIAGDPICLYYGPVSDKDDGPSEIAIPFTGSVLPTGEIKVRELPAHKLIRVRTFAEFNRYPKILEMWNGIGRYVHEQNLASNWDFDMTTYEIWHEDETTSICWPVRTFEAVEAG